MNRVGEEVWFTPPCCKRGCRVRGAVVTCSTSIDKATGVSQRLNVQVLAATNCGQLKAGAVVPVWHGMVEEIDAVTRLGELA